LQQLDFGHKTQAPGTVHQNGLATLAQLSRVQFAILLALT